MFLECSLLWMLIFGVGRSLDLQSRVKFIDLAGRPNPVLGLVGETFDFELYLKSFLSYQNDF